MTIYQATLPVPGRVIPDDPAEEQRVLRGEGLFDDLGCARCHIPSLPLISEGWIYGEPSAAAPKIKVDLTSSSLPQPRLARTGQPALVRVPAFTDFKLHDISDAGDRESAEPLDINQPIGSAEFLGGNRRFLTKRLWGVASQPSHYHHGMYTTIEQSIEAHAGEALESRRAYEQMTSPNRQALLAFLNSLQVLPLGTESLVVDEPYKPRTWPPTRLNGS